MAMIPAALLTAYIYFASGSNRSGDIRGFNQAGIDIGVAADEMLSKREGIILDAELELVSLAGTGRRVFVDSGAYSEVDFPKGVPTVVAPIDDHEWDRRLGFYERLAEALGEQLFVVAPDKVAFQWETLERLERYSDRIQRCRDFGANIIVPHQKGELSLSEFNAYAADFLGFDDFICAFPMQKDATSIADIREFCANVRPARVHLLGIGPKSRGSRFVDALTAIYEVSPETVIFCDSVAISGVAGRDGGGRPYTKHLDAATLEAAVEAWREGVDGVGDYSDSIIDDIEEWLPKSKRSDLIKAVCELSGAMAPRGTAGRLHSWLTEDIDGASLIDNEWVSSVIDEHWARYAHRASSTWRKATAIERHFGGASGNLLRSN